MESDGPRGQGVVLRGGPAGLQQQGEQSAGQPHVTGGRVTMEQGPGAGWAVVTVMLAGQREVLSALLLEFQPRREGGVEGGEGGGGAWWGASLPALGESLPLPSPWSCSAGGFTSLVCEDFYLLTVLRSSLRSLKKSA